MRVGGHRTEQPLQLADAVAHRVVVEELGARGLGDVEVRVEEDLQRLAQVGRLGRALGERAEESGANAVARRGPAPAPATGGGRAGRAGDGSAAVDPRADLDGALRLPEGLGQRRRGADTRLTPAENAIRPPPRSPCTAR